jgi:hypothetical protein
VERRLRSESYVSYKYKGFWQDEQHATYKYQFIFGTMFHTFSEMAMHMDPIDIKLVLDRVIHCFLNHQYYALLQRFELTNSWESNLIAEAAINRASYTGRIGGIKDSKDHESRRLANILSDLREAAETGGEEGFIEKIEEVEAEMEERNK